MQTVTGFVVLDRAGEFVAWSSDFGAAKKRCDSDDSPRASRVERCSDGAVMAFRSAKAKLHPFEEAVPA